MMTQKIFSLTNAFVFQYFFDYILKNILEFWQIILFRSLMFDAEYDKSS